MKKHFLIPALIIISFILSFNNYALDEAQDEIGDELKLYLGEAKIIPINNPTRIVIGNPNIADVTNVTTTEMTLSPKAAGTTRLVFWDNFGEQSYLIKVIPENMGEVKRRVDNILKKLEVPEVYSRLAEEEGKILILGKVKTPQEKERISLALETLKEKITDLILVKEEEAMVEIDVQVLELDKGATDTLGFTWPGSLTITEQGYPTSTAPAKWSTLFNVVKYSRTNFEWKLDLLIQEGKARILSRPRIACQSGKEARLTVGGEVPVLTATYTTAGVLGGAVEYKEHGIILNIKPKVEASQRIHLNLGVEVSDLSTEVETTYAKAYKINKREVSTELFLNNGQTLSIGGLIRQKSEEELRRMPWLSDIPVLGAFFRKRTTTIGGGTVEKGNTELFITITPTIVGKEVEPAEKKTAPVSRAPVSQTPTDPVLGYTQIIQQRILESLSYPASAKQAGFQGTLKLVLHLSYLGELLDVEVRSPSGYKVLDDNAVSVAKDIAYYPPFPSSIDKKELWVEIPIIYRLD